MKFAKFLKISFLLNAFGAASAATIILKNFPKIYTKALAKESFSSEDVEAVTKQSAEVTVTEAVSKGCPVKKVFLRISQNS